MSEIIHIVCLDAPSPPDYGGAIDMYHKIRALSEIGKKVVLHYFDYNPSRSTKDVQAYCSAIYSYKRKNILQSLPLSCPYIVQSRINKDLIQRLNQDDYPILLEGLHCSGIVPFLQKKERIVLRMHNEEASYYHHLAKTENLFLKKKYFQQESKLLYQYQASFDKNIQLACLSETDLETFRNSYFFQQLSFVPCFIPWQQITSKEGKGDFCLYHGNLSVSENNEAACWLIDHVFSKLKIPFIVAGKGASKKLQQIANKYSQIQLINNPAIEEINKLVQEAHINVLPSMNSTGVKLKLLNALLNGRYCLTNHKGVMGSRIHKGVIVKETASDWLDTISLLMQTEFSAAEKKERSEILALYNNRENAHRLNELWKHYQ